MQFVPILYVADIHRALAFYTDVLDFTIAPYDRNLTSPVIDLLRDGAKLQLTTLRENPTGIAVNVDVPGLDELFTKYLSRGLDPSIKAGSPVHQGPLDQ